MSITDKFKKSGSTFLDKFNEKANDDVAVGKYYTTESGYQVSGTDIGESLIEKKFTIEGTVVTDSKYTSNQIVKNTGTTNTGSQRVNYNFFGWIVGEQLTAISANGQYGVASVRQWSNDSSTTRIYITNGSGNSWSTPGGSTVPAGLRGVAVSATGIIAVSGTCANIGTGTSGNGGYHSMYYNHNGDWSDMAKYTGGGNFDIWQKSNMNNGIINLWMGSSSSYQKKGFRHVVLSATGEYGVCNFTDAPNPTYGAVYHTADYGVNWTMNTAVGPLVTWMSSSGQYCYGVKDNILWQSPTYGETWEIVAPGNIACNRIIASADGQYVIRYTVSTSSPYVAYTIYRSDDYGITWTTITNLAGSNKAITKISMSANGRYVIGESIRYLIRSSDYGTTWILGYQDNAGDCNGYGSCSMSADGQYASNYAQFHSGSHTTTINMFKNDSTVTESKDLSEIYEPKMSFSSQSIPFNNTSFYNVGVSGNGNYIFVGSRNNTFRSKISSDRGASWSDVTGLNSYWASGTTALSYDGKYILSGLTQNSSKCAFSTDYGGTWTIYLNNSSGAGMGITVGMSSDGKYMYSGHYNYGNGYGYTELMRSDDYGATWSGLTNFKESNGTWINYTQISLSATGKYGIVIGKGCDIYKTSDYGLTWSSTGAGDGFRMCGIMSKNGKYCVASAGSSLNNKRSGIIYSHDSAATWSASSATALSYDGHYWFSMSMSDSGQYVVAIDVGSKVYTSNDYGVTFDHYSSSGSGRECAMTGKGDVFWRATTMKITKHIML